MVANAAFTDVPAEVMARELAYRQVVVEGQRIAWAKFCAREHAPDARLRRFCEMAVEPPITGPIDEWRASQRDLAAERARRPFAWLRGLWERFV